MRWFQISAGLVPLCGALLIVGLGPDVFEAQGYLAFRVLAVTLIVFGMAGIPLSIHVAALILKSIEVLTNPRAAGQSANGG